MTKPSAKNKQAWKQALEDNVLRELKKLHQEDPGLLECKFYFDTRHGPMNALQYACLEDWQEAALWLLGQGANPSGLLRSKQSALGFAVAGGDIGLVEELLARGASDLDAVSVFGNAPLHTAVIEETQLVSILLAAGADPSVKNDQGQTALDIARERNDREALEALRPAIALEQRQSLDAATPKASRLRSSRI